MFLQQLVGASYNYFFMSNCVECGAYTSGRNRCPSCIRQNEFLRKQEQLNRQQSDREANLIREHQKREDRLNSDRQKREEQFRREEEERERIMNE